MNIDENMEIELMEQMATRKDRIMNNELWRPEDIAGYLKMSKSNVYNKVLKAPSFPEPRQLELAGNKHPIKRWVPKEVMTWATRHH